MQKNEEKTPRPIAKSGIERVTSLTAFYILSIFLLANSAFLLLQYYKDSPTMDFFMIWSVPHALSFAPVSNIYSYEGEMKLRSEMMREASMPGASEIKRRAYAQIKDIEDPLITGTPFLYAAEGLLSGGQYSVEQKRFIYFSLLCFITALFVLCRMLKFSPLETVLLLIFFMVFFEPHLSDLRMGNLNQIQLLIITLFIFLMIRSRDFWAGLILGIGTMLKPNTYLIIPLLALLFLVDKRYRKIFFTLSGICTGIIFSILVSSYYFGGPGIWLQFANSLSSTLKLTDSFELGNFGLSMLIFHLTGKTLSSLILGALVIGYASLVFLTRNRASISDFNKEEIEARRSNEIFSVTGVSCLIILLSSNLVWLHYYVLAIPLLLYLMSPLQPCQFQSSPRLFARFFAMICLLLFSDLAFILFNSPFLASIITNTSLIIIVSFSFHNIYLQRTSYIKHVIETRSAV